MYLKISRFETGCPGWRGGMWLLFFFVFQKDRRRQEQNPEPIP